MIFLLPAGLLAECWSYRGVILVGVLCRQATRVLLLWGSGLRAMQLMQVTYAAATSAEAVYLAYPFCAVGPRHFAVVSMAARGAIHFGNALGSGIGQALVSLGSPIRPLFFLSWGCTSAGLLSLVLLPPSLTQRRGATAADGTAPPSVATIAPSAALKEVWQAFSTAGPSSALSIWSMWWVFGAACSQIFMNYYQVRYSVVLW